MFIVSDFQTKLNELVRPVSMFFLGIILVQANSLLAQSTTEQSRLNVLWIVADDLSPELSCYGYKGVQTPNVDRIAAQGIQFTLAFATSPVCSPSRTAYEMGHYQTSVGGHHHQTRDLPLLPESPTTLTQWMRELGYFVCNGVGTSKAVQRRGKTDFNFVYDRDSYFDGTDWSYRAEDQPFFAQVQIKQPHRPFIVGDHYRKGLIPPYYPSHSLVRIDWSNYLASIEYMDQKVGEVLDRLDADGLADNTVVFFFGDNGRAHVRDKQFLYDGGLRVPLLIRQPGPTATVDVDDRLTSLLDLMPTTLMIGGMEENQLSQLGLPGKNLLGNDKSGHERLYAARDRCGDAVDRIRSVRDRRFKYIRNYHTDVPYLQMSGYKERQYPVLQLMRVLNDLGRFNTLFMQRTRPFEELYDLEADPYEMVSIADHPAHAETVARMSDELDQWIDETLDQGEIDESLTVDVEALIAEKRQYYEQKMQERGLDPYLTPRQYLSWWKETLNVP